MDSHECDAKCVNCGGAHPATDSRCPSRQQAPYNKTHVKKYLQQQHHDHQQGNQRPQQAARSLKPRQATQVLLSEEQWPRLPSRGWETQNPYDLLASEASDPASTGPQGSDTRPGTKRNRSRSKAKSRSRSRARPRSRRRKQQQQQSAQGTQTRASRSPGPAAPK
ncbi:unnamed protein product, partial [Ixodes hexagonus]